MSTGNRHKAAANRGEAIRNQSERVSRLDTKRFLSALCASAVNPIFDLRLLIYILCALLLALSSSVEAQQKAKAPRIGWLGLAGLGSRIELFRRELRELGYVEGSNITIEVRTADDKIDRLRVLADELTRLQVDVLVVPSTPGAIAAKNITRTIPIVFIGSADPVAAGLVDSLARPGGNVTGFTTIGAILAGKRLEVLKETVPHLPRVAVLWNSDDPRVCNNGKKANYRHAIWASISIPWRCAAPVDWRMRSKPRLRHVALLSR